jgi:NEDD8-activating enzyme E1 regulatory subunit
MSGVNEKEQKYDRQLRLWGAHGQAALEHAHVLLLTGDGLGSEVLKNLVLPALGAFTVRDDATVRARDTSESFFVDAESVGSARALVVAKLLGELNPDVVGHAVVKPVGSVEREELARFTLVIAR